LPGNITGAKFVGAYVDINNWISEATETNNDSTAQSLNILP